MKAIQVEIKVGEQNYQAYRDEHGQVVVLKKVAQEWVIVRRGNWVGLELCVPRLPRAVRQAIQSAICNTAYPPGTKHPYSAFYAK
jgi:hypothetical protein